MREVPSARLLLGDCRERLGEIADASVDAVICDPPYPEISRPYGRMTEAEWHAMMRVVVPECRRVLKPTGSAVFVLQPNSRKVGSMRLWLWEFVSWAGREWNLVQDVHWWNFTAAPTVHSQRINGLMRPSLKMCVWLGPEDCYRDQDSVLWEVSKCSPARLENRALQYSPFGGSKRDGRMFATAQERGGSTPFNVLPIAVTPNESNLTGQSATTPMVLADWWIRYITPPGGIVCDPFMGSGTTGLAALKLGRAFIGIEKESAYVEIARRRLDALQVEPALFS